MDLILKKVKFFKANLKMPEHFNLTQFMMTVVRMVIARAKLTIENCVTVMHCEEMLSLLDTIYSRHPPLTKEDVSKRSRKSKASRIETYMKQLFMKGDIVSYQDIKDLYNNLDVGIAPFDLFIDTLNQMGLIIHNKDGRYKLLIQ